MKEKGWDSQPFSFTMDGRAMKKTGLVILALVIALTTASCATEGYNTQRGAAVGAALGAIAGQAIGRNTAGTLIGAAGGALAGAIIGNAHDQAYYDRRLAASEQGAYRATPAPNGSAYAEAPPGEWVTVPGRWVNGKWVPSHREWFPVNPR
jgi:surface antigen